MAWHPSLADIAIPVLAGLIVGGIVALLRRRRAPDERGAGEDGAAPAAPPAPGQARPPPPPKAPTPRQPGDALLADLRQVTSRTRDERSALRARGKLQSPVDLDDADGLCALRIAIEDELARDPDPRQRRVRRRQPESI